MGKILKWIIANTSDRLVWRVKYLDGRKTRLLSYHEASNLKQIYGGKLYIDYEKGWFN